jgi:hypothetical protein
MPMSVDTYLFNCNKWSDCFSSFVDSWYDVSVDNFQTTLNYLKLPLFWESESLELHYFIFEHSSASVIREMKMTQQLFFVWNVERQNVEIQIVGVKISTPIRPFADFSARKMNDSLLKRCPRQGRLTPPVHIFFSFNARFLVQGQFDACPNVARPNVSRPNVGSHFEYRPPQCCPLWMSPLGASNRTYYT